jgi:hypothetical protein
MGSVHQLIHRIGIEEARRQAATKHERSLVEAAYQVLTEEADRCGFTYSGFRANLASPQAAVRSDLAPRGPQLNPVA